MRTSKIVAGAALLFIGTIASFKCLGDIKRPLLGIGAGQHSIAGNAIGWLLFGLAPIILTHRCWKRRAEDVPDGGRRARTLATTALVFAVVAAGSHSLIGPAQAGIEPSDMWYGLLVIMPLTICALIAASASLVIAMISLSLAGRATTLHGFALFAASASVLLTCH